MVNIAPDATQYIDIDADGDELTVTETANAAVVDPITREWKFSETAGTGYVSFAAPETGTTYTPNFDTPGIYYVVCETDFGTEVILSNEVEIVVSDPAVNSVTISPSGSQTLLATEDGEVLTATESPELADSREWKFSETTGTGYGSFSPAVTDLTYTPNFATVGTYYVICESDFAGDIQTSNEVTIMVPSAAGIQTEEMNFTIYNNGSSIVVNTSEFETAVFALFNLQGQLVYEADLTSATSIHNLETTGTFIYQLRKGDRIITGKIAY